MSRRSWIWGGGAAGLVLASAAFSAPADPDRGGSAAGILLPSGYEVHLDEVLWDRPGWGLTYRYRFVSATWFEGSLSDETRSSDMAYLCSEFAVPRVASTGPQPAEIVISVSSKSKDFGVYDEEIEELFESYTFKDGACEWLLY